MDLRVVIAIVCLCALAINPTAAGIRKCCVTTKKDISIPLLIKVQSWKIQQSSGACDIPALLLQVRGLRQPICAHPKEKRILMWLQLKRKQNRLKASY